MRSADRDADHPEGRPFGRPAHFDRLTGADAGRTGGGMRRDLLTLVLLTVVSATVVLPAVAYASPPDPSWIPGIYDDGDFDNVVDMITSATGHVAPLLPAAPRPIQVSVERLPRLVEVVTSPLRSSNSDPRAPPSS